MESLVHLRTGVHLPGRRGRPGDAFAVVVHATLADPRRVAPAVDPNERTPGSCCLGDPRAVNTSTVGPARFCTLRSRRLFEAIGHQDHEMHQIPGADRYDTGPEQRETPSAAVGICTGRPARHGFAGAPS